MDRARLSAILARFPALKIAVVGDFFLDKALVISREFDEPSVETGLAAYQVTGKGLSPGAAGTVANNLRALEVGRVIAVGAMGDDGEGYELSAGLRARGVDTAHLHTCAGMHTPTYIKPQFKHADTFVESNRMDIKNRAPLPRDAEDAILQSLSRLDGQVDGVILLDQVTLDGTGVLTERVRAALVVLAEKPGAPVVFYDSRERQMGFPRGVTKCNNIEAVAAVMPGADPEDENIVRKCAVRMLEGGRRAAMITMGAKGACVAWPEGVWVARGVNVPPPVDVCGAGDSVSAGFVAALCAGASYEEAAVIGNLVASITIQQLGTTGTATRAQVLERLAVYAAQA